MHDFQIYILIHFCLLNLVTSEEVVLQYLQIIVYLSVSSCSSSHFLFINFWGSVNSNKGLPQWLSSKESSCNARDAEEMGLIPRSERFPGGGRT